MNGLLLDTTALAAIALLAYVTGRRSRSQSATQSHAPDAVDQAQRSAIEVRGVADQMRRELASHLAGVSSFRTRIEQVRSTDDIREFPDFVEQVDALFEHANGLAAALSNFYEELRREIADLDTAAGGRLDGATGAFSRHALQSHLQNLLDVDPGCSQPQFCVGSFAVTAHDDHDEEMAEAHLARVARILHNIARDTDFVARYGRDEFAVLMPQTPLSGASVFCDRVLRRVGAELGLPIWGGVAEVAAGETAEKLLSRTDAALYTARTQPIACLFKHDGATIRRHMACPAANPPGDGTACEPAAAAAHA